MGAGASPIRQAGRLCHSPVDLSAAWPHGGTGCGLVQDVMLAVQSRGSRVVIAEEYGEAVEAIKGGRQVWLSCRLRDHDADMLALAWSKTTGASGSPLVSIPGAHQAGRLGSTSSKAVLWSPRDTTGGYAILLYRAIPELEEEHLERYSVFSESPSCVVVFRAIRDPSGRIAQIGRLGDLTL